MLRKTMRGGARKAEGFERHTHSFLKQKSAKSDLADFARLSIRLRLRV